MRCLSCTSLRLLPHYRAVRDHYGIASGEHRFLSCSDCGSVTLDPLPAPESLEEAYSPDYTFKPPTGHPGSIRRALGSLEWRLFYRPGYRRRLQIFQRLTGLQSGKVLEIGCGSGLFLRHLADAGYDVEGIELSRSDVEYARRRLGLSVLHGRLEMLPLASDWYDAVLLIYVLEHVIGPDELLARVRDVLKPGGWVVLGLPVMDSGQSRWLGARWSAVTEAPRHVMIPSFEGARSLLSRAGLVDLRWAPAPLVENAGHVALSLVPGAAAPRSYAAARPVATLLRRLCGAIVMPPALLVAWAERLPGGPRARAGTMFFAGRKTDEKERHVP